MSLTITENCPVCGCSMSTYYSTDSEFQVISQTVCTHCGYAKPELTFCTYADNDNGVAIGRMDCNLYKNIIIDADTLKLHQKGVDITMDISNEILNKIEIVEINGFKFIKEQ